MTARLGPADFDVYADEAPDPLYEALMAAGTADYVTAVEALLTRPAWHRHAACRGSGPADFYIGQGGDPKPARETCRRCPVRSECLDAGLDDLYGTWGGMSPEQRKQERRRRGAA